MKVFVGSLRDGMVVIGPDHADVSAVLTALLTDPLPNILSITTHILGEEDDRTD